MCIQSKMTQGIICRAPKNPSSSKKRSKRPKTIKNVLLSLTKLREKIETIEIIVVNDGSKDNSLKILKENHNYYDVYLPSPPTLFLQTAPFPST